MTPSIIATLCVLVPLIGAALIYAFGRHPNIREAATLVTAVTLFALVLSLLPDVMAGSQPFVILAQPLPTLTLALKVEPLGMLFALLASFLWLVTSVYSIGYMRGHDEPNQTRFYVYFAVAISATLGVAFAADMLTLFVFYEVLTLSTVPLVTHAGTNEAKRAGRIYLGLLLGTSLAILLPAIIWTWMVAGTLAFTAGGILSIASPMSIALLLTMYIFGIGKAAVMPFHRWLPAAMVAPTPVSALLHAVAVVKAGVFAIVKVTVYVFGLDLLADLGARQWLMYAAAFTVLAASLVALRKDNLKARLAYSTVSQLSYIVLGALLANPLATIGSGMHILMHGFGKITLFFCAGAIAVATHKTEISQMRGLGRRMPVTMTAFFIASLSIIGLPPTGGLWSKWYLALGTLEANETLLLGVLLLSSLLSLAYLLPIPVRAFFYKAADNGHSYSALEAPFPALLALVITSLGCLLLFFYPELSYQLMTRVTGRAS
ncbi:MAG: proton-conducting transporter membrane subunit [Gammaproteobacteria bacterium]|nr:proton-conducting transporter membrane subunit [Gammaproteobacteria bacterium]